MKGVVTLLCLVWCAGISGRLWGQEKPLEPADVSADEVNFQVIDGKNVIVGKGNVHVSYGGVQVRSDYAEFRQDDNQVYAKGNLLIRSPEYEVRAEEGEYDFSRKVGTLKKGTAVYLPEGWQGELYCRGETVRVFPDMLILERGRFTTCDKRWPHYVVVAKKVLIFPKKSVVGKHATFRVLGVPIIYTPYVKKSLKETHFRVSAGHRDFLGMYGTVCYFRNWDLGKRTTTRFKLDAMQRQGVGLGIKGSSEWEGLGGGKAEIDSYYASGGESYGDLYVDEPRWMVRGCFLEKVTDELVFKGKTDVLSDADVVKHFFWRDYKKDPTVETYGNVAWLRDEFGVYALADVNIQDFETDVERLPQLDFDWKRSALANTGILVDVNSQFADLTNGLIPQYDEDSGLAAEITAGATEEETSSASQQDVSFIRSDRRILRYDLSGEISRPFRVADVLGIEPSVEYEGTYYSDLYQGLLWAPDGTYEADVRGSEWRNAVTGQLQTRTSMHRTYEGGGFVPDAELLRHEIEPTLTYAYRPEPTLEPGQLIQFDSMDALDASNCVSLELINRWEKKNVAGQKSQVARVDAGITQEMAEGQKSFVTLETWLTIWDLWSFTTDTEYDTSAAELARSNSSLSIQPADFLTFQFGTWYYPRSDTSTSGTNDNLDVTAAVTWQVLEGLKLQCVGMYDCMDSNMEEVDVSIRKSIHCWETVLAYSKRRELDEQQLAVFLCIKALPDFDFSFSGGFQ